MRSVPTVLVIAAAVVVTVAGLPPVGAAGTSDARQSAVAPGERLRGVVGVQEAEIEGEVETRAFAVAFSRADSNASKAAVVARQARDLEERVRELERRKQALREARENGTLTEGEFRAEMAVLAAEIATTRRLANRTAMASRRLPEAALENAGVNVTALRRMRGRAANLTGPEMAEIARSIAGPDVGKAPGERGPPAVVGPPTNRTGDDRGKNASDGRENTRRGGNDGGP